MFDGGQDISCSLSVQCHIVYCLLMKIIVLENLDKGILEASVGSFTRHNDVSTVPTTVIIFPTVISITLAYRIRRAGRTSSSS